MTKKKKLLLDIETSLMDVVTFQIGRKVSLNHNQIMRPSKIICVGYMWDDDKDKDVKCLEFDLEKYCHKQLLIDLIEISKEADEIVGYNGDNFDIKWIAGAIALEGLKVPWHWTPSTDPLKQYRRSFRFPSNKLDAIAQALNIGGKSPMNMSDWVGVRNKDPKSMAKMVKYCKRDVTLMKKVFKRLDKYTKKTVMERNLERKNHSVRPDSCTVCEKSNLIRYGVAQGLQKWYCKNCGKVQKT